MLLRSFSRSWFPLSALSRPVFLFHSLFQELRFLRREILVEFHRCTARTTRRYCVRTVRYHLGARNSWVHASDHRCVIRCARVVRSTWHVFDVPFLEEWVATDRHEDLCERENEEAVEVNSAQMQSYLASPPQKRRVRHRCIKFFSLNNF